MRYLCKLVTPPEGIVLDPFCGSGSTGCGAVLEGFSFAGIDITEEYCEIASARIQHYLDNAGHESFDIETDEDVPEDDKL